MLAAPEIVQLAADGQNAGFDAVVLYCFSDPVIDACREALRIPVIGGAQASCLAALNICRSFGVILADEARLPEKKTVPAHARRKPGTHRANCRR